MKPRLYSLVRERLICGSYPGTRVILFFVILLGGIVAIHRPYLPHLLPSYARFDDLMPFTYWGWAGLVLAALMVVTKPGSLPALAVNFCISVYLFALGLAFTASVGVVLSSTTCFVLGMAAMLLFADDFRGWLPKVRVMQHLSDNPPAFVKKVFSDRQH